MATFCFRPAAAVCLPAKISIMYSFNHLMQIMQLEKHLKDQQVVRGALEKALGPDAASVNLSPENPMPKVIPSPKNFFLSALKLLSPALKLLLFITHQVNHFDFFRLLMN